MRNNYAPVSSAFKLVLQDVLTQVEGMAGMEVLESTVTALEQLANLYARPSERVLRKEIDHVDAVGRAFIAASPFLILASGGSQGLDCSPKGDKTGFVQV